MVRVMILIGYVSCYVSGTYHATCRARVMLRGGYVSVTCRARVGHVSCYVSCYVSFFEMSNDDESFDTFADDFDCQLFATKKFKCKYSDCSKSYSTSQSRSRHYRQDHSAEMPPKKIPATTTTNYNYNYNYDAQQNFVDLVDAPPVNERSLQLKADEKTKQAIDLVMSFFNSENTETAVALIKGSRTVQESALEMKSAIDAL